MIIAIFFGFFVAKMSSVTISDIQCKNIEYKGEACKEAKFVNDVSQNFK
jgi:hypothetical protein